MTAAKTTFTPPSAAQALELARSGDIAGAQAMLNASAAYTAPTSTFSAADYGPFQPAQPSAPTPPSAPITKVDTLYIGSQPTSYSTTTTAAPVVDTKTVVGTKTVTVKPPTQALVLAASNAAIVATTNYDKAVASGRGDLTKLENIRDTATTKATTLLTELVTSTTNKLDALTKAANNMVSVVDVGANKKVIGTASNANNVVNSTAGNVNKITTALTTLLSKNPSLRDSDIFTALSDATTSLTGESRDARNAFFTNAIDIAAATGNRDQVNKLQVNQFTAIQNDVVADATTAMQIQGKTATEIASAVKTIKTEIGSNIKEFRTQLSDVNRVEKTQLQNLAAAQKAELTLLTDAFKAQGLTGKALKTAVNLEKTANTAEYTTAKIGLAEPTVQTLQGVGYDKATGTVTGNVRSTAASYADNAPVKTAVDTKLDAAFSILTNLNIPMSYSEKVKGGTINTGLNVETIVKNVLPYKDEATGEYTKKNWVTKLVTEGEKYINKTSTPEQLSQAKLTLKPAGDPVNNVFVSKTGDRYTYFQKDADGNFKGLATTRANFKEDDNEGFFESIGLGGIGHTLDGLTGNKFVQAIVTMWNPAAGAALTAFDVGTKTDWDLGAMAKAGGTTYLSSQVLPGVMKGVTSGFTKAVSNQLVSTLGETAANAAANGITTGATNALIGRILNPDADIGQLFGTGFVGGAVASSADVR